MKKKKIIFFCNPGFGLLDNIIPILCSLDKSKFYITTIFIKKYFVRQLSNNDLIIEKLNENCNEFIFIDKDNLFYSHNNIYDLINLHKKIKLIEFLNNVIDSITYFFYKKIFLKLDFFFLNLSYKIKFIYKYSHILKKKKINQILKEQDIMIYDICSEKAIYFEYFKTYTDKIKKISLFHGSDFPPQGDNFMEEPIIKKKVENVSQVFFSTSKYEKNFYSKYFAYNKKNNFYIGNPKLSKGWIEEILNANKKNILKFKNYIFLISRPANKYFFPISQKIDFLNSIKLIMKETNLNLIVKLHPKESENLSHKVYEDIFEKKNYNINWSFSNFHPYFLGKNSRFAVSFYSAVAVDLWQVNCPTIEYMNLKDINLNQLKEHNRDLFRQFFSKNNILITKQLFFDIVLGASNHMEFKTQVKNLLTNKRKILDIYKRKMSDLFIINQNSNKNFEKLINNLLNK